MKEHARILIIVLAGLVGLPFADSSGSIEPSAQQAAKNDYETDLSITHLDIFLKTDFQSNNVDTVVKASVENFSENTVQTAEFWLCQSGNDLDLSADVKHIYSLDKDKKRDLKYAIRRTDNIYRKGRGSEIYVVSFERPIGPGEKLNLQFEYTLKGKPDHSSTPIHQPKEGLKELYLRGSDWMWCPSLYVRQKPKVYTRSHRTSWRLKIEYPATYLAVVDGELVEREQKAGVVKEEWKSVIDVTPHVYISKYKVVRLTKEGVTLEVYAPDEKALQKASEKSGDYIRVFNLYVELFGHPGSSIYRIVGSPDHGGGIGMAMGQVVGTVGRDSLEDMGVVAHEMAHTWWGHLVCSYGEGTKFLREAMAEFSRMWAMRTLGKEHYLGMSYFDDDWIRFEKMRYFCMYFAVPDASKWAPLLQQDGYDPSTVSAENYHRGPLVLNQMRLTLGDEVFFKCLKAFATKYRGKTVNIHDFIDTINRVSGRDMTSELKGLLWSTGHASYRLAGFASEKQDGGYQTKVRIQNEGEYGLSCPLLLKMRKGAKREVFKVEAKDEKQFVFTTDDEVIEVIVDPDLTTFQYHPDQKVRLWQVVKPVGRWGWYNKSCMYYATGEYEKAIETITEYFASEMERKKAKSTAEIAESLAAYLFMRGVYYLALDDREHAEEDIKTAFPHMLEALQQGESVGPPSAYYRVGAIPEEDLDQYLSLLKLIAGRKFSFDSGSDDAAKKRQVEGWKQWWEKEGKQKKLDLHALKEKCEAQRKAFRQCEPSLMQPIERTGQ